MKSAELPKFEILDCTIRDGGYINDWRFEEKLVREVYRALSKAGVDYVEIGYRGTRKHFDIHKFGLWRFSEDDKIYEVTKNIQGAKLAVMADYGKIEVDDFCDAKDSLVSLVRVAVHKDKLKEAIFLLEQIKKKGYAVSLNAMGYDNYSKNERDYLAGLIAASGIDYVYVADSYGSMFPNQIEGLLEPLLRIPTVRVGFHPHNNIQMAFANTLAAISSGVHIVDSTIYGMGRAAGNLPTEIIVLFLENGERGRYNSVPILNIIDRFFVALKKEEEWGYQLPFMLSGMFQCHPSYATALIEAREYTIEDVRSAMEHIREENTVGYSKQLLERIIAEGFIGRLANGNAKDLEMRGIGRPDELKTDVSVPYMNRHKGRDFLILANGPSLKEYREKIIKFIDTYDPIIIGANYLGDLLIPHYHAFTNKRRFIEYVETVSPQSKLLISQYIDEAIIREYTAQTHESISYIDRLDHDFGINNGVIQANCRTVSVLLLGVAIVMGANRVFCVGMDGYLGGEVKKAFHYYDEKDEKENKEMIIDRHRWCQKFLEQIDEYLINRESEGIHILTPTSYKSFYKGIENYIVE